jgi:hypothetical protein
MAKQTAPTSDVLQVIPPIIVSSPTAIAGCTVLNLSPGSAVTGTNGFIQANCPNGAPAVIFGVATETPTFLLATGFAQVSLMYYSSSCNFHFFSTFAHRLVGTNLTSSGPITFTSQSNSTTQLLAGGYNYCLYYQNPPVNGILSFTIAWSP